MFEALEVGQVSSFQGSVGRAVVVIGPGGSVILLLEVLWLGLRSCSVQVDLYLTCQRLCSESRVRVRSRGTCIYVAVGPIVGAVVVFGPGGPVAWLCVLYG